VISVLVPFVGDGDHRSRAWAWLEQRWAAIGEVLDTIGGFELVVQDAEGTAGDFRQSWAINRAAERASGDTFVIVDADVALEGGWVYEAVRLVEEGDARWVLPQLYRQLTPEATEQVLAASPHQWVKADLPAIWEGDGVSWTGGVVLTREAFDTVGGYETSFGGWAGNDVAFAAALETLWGPLSRLDGAATHLWHPRNGLDAQPQSSHDLMYRYIEARGDVDAMRALIAERQVAA
jgi:glycosyltransferase involved in cell wall biosynthesis